MSNILCWNCSHGQPVWTWILFCSFKKYFKLLFKYAFEWLFNWYFFLWVWKIDLTISLGNFPSQNFKFFFSKSLNFSLDLITRLSFHTSEIHPLISIINVFILFFNLLLSVSRFYIIPKHTYIIQSCFFCQIFNTIKCSQFTLTFTLLSTQITDPLRSFPSFTFLSLYTPLHSNVKSHIRNLSNSFSLSWLLRGI